MINMANGPSKKINVNHYLRNYFQIFGKSLPQAVISQTMSFFCISSEKINGQYS